MGTRQLQKLQGKELLPGQDEATSEESESGDEVGAAPAFNPFLLLGDEEDEPVSEDDEVTQHEEPVKPEPPASRSRSKSKGLKKSKQSKKAQESVDAAHDIDAALKDLGLDAGPAPTAAPQALHQGQTFSFEIDKKLLSPDQELRAIFGSSVLALEGRQRRAPPGPNRRGQPQHTRARLLSQQADLPPYDGSLTMSCISSGTDAVSAFRIEPSSRYRTATLHFEQAQASMDPNNIAAVLAAHPFHVHSMITMSDIYQTSGQGDYSAAMLNRALYALEGAWDPAFKACMLRGTARLPAEEGANSLMYAALARRVRALCRQGMHRTALEWAKLTLRLDDADPAGLLLLMDYLALRAREYDMIEGLVEAWDGPTSLRLVPSYPFSTALAAYYAGKAASAEAATATGVHEAGARPELDVRLVNAIITFPLAVQHLVKAMQEKDAAKSANWQSVMRRRLFAEPRGAASATLQHLCAVFAARHDELWKAPDVLAWLLRCAEAAADAADAAAAGAAAAAAPRVHASQIAVADANTLIDLMYPESSQNEFSHCAVADYTDTVAAVPQEQAAGGLGGGGVPPELEEMAEEIARNLIQQSGTRQLSDEELQSANPVMAMLRTLMPWVSVAGGAGAAGGAAAEAEVLQQVPGLTEFLANAGLDVTRAVPPAERARVLQLVREFLMMQHGGVEPA